MLGDLTRNSAKIPRNIFSILNLYGAIIPYSFIVLSIYPKCQLFISSFVSGLPVVPRLIFSLCIFLGYFFFSRLFFIPIVGYTKKIVKFVLVIVFLTSILALYKLFSLFPPLVFITIMSYGISLIAFLMFKERGILNFGSLIIFYNVALPIFSRVFWKWVISREIIYSIVGSIVSLLKVSEDSTKDENRLILKYLWSIIEFFTVVIFWVLSISYLSEITLFVLGKNTSFIISTSSISYSGIMLLTALIFVIELIICCSSIYLVLKYYSRDIIKALKIEVSLGESKVHADLSEYLTSVINSLYSIALLGKGNKKNYDSVILVFLHLLGTTYEVICRDVKCVCGNRKNKETEIRTSKIFLYAFHEFIKIPLIIEKDKDWDDEINIMERILKDQKMEKAGYISSLRKDILYPDSSKSWIEIKYRIYCKK